MQWRLIKHKSHSPYENLALEEACMHSVGSGASPPTVRFYGWDNSAVVLGYFQRVHDEIDVEACKKNKVHIARRITGGGAMYLDNKGEITYMVVVPQHIFPDITKTYHEVCNWIIRGLGQIGIDAQFRPINDVVVQGRKISGSALTRRHGAVMVHGTLLYDTDPEKMFTVLKVGREKISDKPVTDIKKAVTSVVEHKQIRKNDVVKALTHSFMMGKKFTQEDWTLQEMLHARQLVENKYKTEEWIFRR